MDFETIAPNFRLARDRWPNAPTLTAHYEVLENIYRTNGHGLVDAAKSFLESVCLTVLSDFGTPMPTSTPSSTEMLVAALRVLGLQNSRGANKLDRVLSAYNRLSDALSEMRNDCGPVAHGREGFLDRLTIHHTRAFLLVGDSILSILLSALDGKEPDIEFTREPYETFVHLHEKVDASVSVGIELDETQDVQVVVVTFDSPGLPDGYKLRIEPSRLLFNVDRTAYIEFLAAAGSVELLEESLKDSDEEEQEEARVDEPETETAQLDTEKTEIVPVPSREQQVYTGHLSILRDSLSQYLASMKISVDLLGAEQPNIVDAILSAAEQNMGVDWENRMHLQARMKVGFRRLLAKFEVTIEDSEALTEHLVTWFKMLTTPNMTSESTSSFTEESNE